MPVPCRIDPGRRGPKCRTLPRAGTADRDPTLHADRRASAHDRVLLGILFICLAKAPLFPVMNGLVQVLSPRYPSEQIVRARVISHLLFILVLFGPRLEVVPLVPDTLRPSLPRPE